MLEPFSRHQSVASTESSYRNFDDTCAPFPEQVLPDGMLPFVSLVVPAYNEALIIARNLDILCHYMEGLESQYRWELVIVNDGSRDQTAEAAEGFAITRNNVHVVHHRRNLGLGEALKSGAQACQGQYIITMDLDLSYSTEHIERLLNKIRQTGAKVVVASPYMEGGQVSNVPWLRRLLSVWANRFLSLAAKRNVITLTGMVRAYDARFLKALNLRSPGMEINPEIIHKAALLNERVEEIPAHLHWSTQRANRKPGRARRKSSMKILRHTWSVLFFGFLFRPVMFFIIPSLVFFLLSLYANTWVLIHCWANYQQLAQLQPFPNPTEAVAMAFQQAPHTFVIGGMLLMLAIQLFSLGLLSVQNKRYFEEVFYLGTATYRSSQGLPKS